MIRRCAEVGLPEPEFRITDGFVTIIRRPARAGAAAQGALPEITGEVTRLLAAFSGEHGRQELQRRLGLKGEENFRALYLVPALELELIEMARPGAPRSRLQKYRLTEKGRAVVPTFEPESRP